MALPITVRFYVSPDASFIVIWVLRDGEDRTGPWPRSRWSLHSCTYSVSVPYSLSSNGESESPRLQVSSPSLPVDQGPYGRPCSCPG
jgi:hypothetical protein